MATANRVTLADYQKRSNQPLERGIMKAFLSQNPWLNNWPVDTTGTLSGKYRARTSLPGPGNRLINEAFSPSVSHTEQRSWGMSIYGVYVDMDTQILTEPGGAEEQSEQVAAQTDGLSMTIADALINGDVALNSKAFDGLKILSTTLPSRMTVAGAGLDLSTAALRKTNGLQFLLLLETLKQRVKQGTGGPPDVFLVGDEMELIIGDAARQQGGSWWSITKDGDRDVGTVAGVKVETTGFNSAGNLIIASNHDGSAGITSIYAIRLGQQYVHLKQKSKMSVGKPDLLDDQVTSRIKIEWALSPVVKNDFSLGRLSGLKIA